MIELIYNEEPSGSAEEKLPEPKNMKQIGEPKEYKKIFIEDFVYTFLQQYSVEEAEKIRLAILFGSSERAGGKRHLYVKSALPVEGVTEKQGKYYFTEQVWGDVYRDCEKYFPGQEILGWFLSRPGFAPEKNSVMEETHRTYFSGADKLLFLMEPLEKENAFFGFDGNRFARQSGYCIYYEKNEPMQEFIMDKNEKQKRNLTSEKPDVVMANFRKILKEKQEQNEKRKKQAVSYGVKLAAVLLLFVGVISFKDQIKLPAFEMPQTSPVSVPNAEAVSGDEVLVEELPGNVEEQPKEIYEEQPEELPVTKEPEEPETPEEKEPEEDLKEDTEEPVEEPVIEVPAYQEYQVQAGDTLAKISRKVYGTDTRVAEICALNEISDGDYIQAGEIILLPEK